jgi:hypothetical protein
MPNHARSYISGVIAAGAFSILAGLLQPWADDPVRFACIALLALAGGSLRVKIPGLTGNISLSFVFVLLGVAVLNFPETLAIACTATAIQCLLKTTRRQTPVQVVFNIAAVALSTTVAYWGPRVVIAPEHVSYLLATLTISATLYFTANTLLVSTVLALINRQRVRSVWVQCHLWSFPYYVIGAGVAALAALGTQSVGWKPSMVMLPAMYLVYLSYRHIVDRLAPVAVAE